MVVDFPLYDSADSVFKENTGKNLAKWFRILKRWNALKMGHTLTVEYLQTKFKLESGWAQAVAVRYQKDKLMKKE